MSKNEHAGQPNSENPLTQKDRFRLIRQVNEAFDQRIPTTIVGNNTQYDIDYAKRAVESLKKDQSPIGTEDAVLPSEVFTDSVEKYQYLLTLALVKISGGSWTEQMTHDRAQTLTHESKHASEAEGLEVKYGLRFYLTPEGNGFTPFLYVSGDIKLLQTQIRKILKAVDDPSDTDTLCLNHE